MSANNTAPILASPISAVTVEPSVPRLSEWTEQVFKEQVSLFVNSQKQFVEGVTRCTLYAVRTAMMSNNNQPLNYILGNLSEKLRPAWSAWLFYFSPFQLAGGKDATSITLDDGTIVDLKSSIKLSAKRCDELCNLSEIPLLNRDKGGNINDPAGMTRLCDTVLGALRGAPRFDTWKKDKGAGKGEKPLTTEEMQAKYDAITKRLAKLMEQAKASGVHDPRKFPGIETPHSFDYYVSMLENADENDMDEKTLAKVRLMKGEAVPFRTLLNMVSECDTTNLTAEEEFVYNALLNAAVDKGIEL